MQVYRFLVFLLIETFITVTIANNQPYTICNTDECKNAASKMLNNLNTTVNPCDNFYQFACDGWIANHPLGPSEMHKTIFTVLDDVIKELINEILVQPEKPDDTVAIRCARDIYKLCMNNAESDSDEIGVLDAFTQKFGQWPITLPSSEWNINNDVSWQDMIDKICDTYNENGLFSIRVRTHPKNSSIHVIIITQPILSISRDIYESFNTNVERKTKYKNYIETVAQAFVKSRGSNVDNDDIAADALNIINFESELSQLTKTNAELIQLGSPFTILTVHEWQEDYDFYVNNSTSNMMRLNWLNLLQRIFQPLGITISSSDIVMVPVWHFFSGLVALLGRTPIRTIVNYIQWSFIKNQLPYTTKNLEDLFMDIRREFQGIEIPTSRWKLCADIPNLSTAISYEYAKKYVQHENKEDLKKMIENIAEVVRNQIIGTSWMDEATKTASIEKLNYTRHQISTPDSYTNAAIDKIYENITMNNFTALGYCKSILEVQAFKKRTTLNLLRKPVDKNKWPFEPTMPEAFYLNNINTILITAAIIQNPTYETTRPMVINYGSIGIILGHEINHGFDNFGRLFDKNGNKIDWWTNETSENYKNVTQCFVDQYNNYTVPGLESLPEQDNHVNGRLTLGENIGDSAGVIAAYRAYKNRKKQLQESEIRLPGLEDYSEDQLFFMSIGNVLCENISLNKTLILRSDAHPRSEIRIRGSFSNSVEFSQAYACAEGTNMNPIKKCTLW